MIMHYAVFDTFQRCDFIYRCVPSTFLFYCIVSTFCITSFSSIASSVCDVVWLVIIYIYLLFFCGDNIHFIGSALSAFKVKSSSICIHFCFLQLMRYQIFYYYKRFVGFLALVEYVV